MRGAVAPVWHRLCASPVELRLDTTLANGQCFGWHRQPNDDWVGVLGSRLVSLRDTESDTLFRCLSALPPAAPSAATEEELLRDELRDYFQLATELEPLYRRWSSADERMAAVAGALPGMRVLRQEPSECLVSFICSSNNHIGRIGGMLQALRRTYGTPLPAPSDGGPAPSYTFGSMATGSDFYTFPSAGALAAASEAELRGLGLGYRAAFIRETAQSLLGRDPAWLASLRRCADPDAVRSQLCELKGVGPKVADCVALFSLDQTGCIPVDTHVWQIACRDLDPALKARPSLTPAVYSRVGELFRERFGPHAGWAHSVLFAAELPLFSDRLPEATRREMEAFKAAGKAERLQAKAAKEATKAERAAGGGAQGGGEGRAQPQGAKPKGKRAAAGPPAAGRGRAKKAEVVD